MREGLKLSVYMGERDRVEGGLLADVVMAAFERHNVDSSVLLRGIEGFGFKHRLQSAGLLTLSEDLPLVALAVDEPARIRTALAEVRSVSPHGLLALERAQLLDDGEQPPAASGPDAYKLTIYAGRGEREGAQPAHVAIVDCLHRSGLDGASVLLGLDGHTRGARRRAHLLARNSQVPLMIVSVGEWAAVARALMELSTMQTPATITLERVRVCRRDGVVLGEPHGPQPQSPGWQKLVIYAGEQSTHRGQPLHSALVRRLRREGAAGATVLRGLWGYHGEHEPHGERFWSLRRHVPAVIEILDTAANASRWFEMVAEMTDEAGLVTSEIVPAARAAGPGVELGDLTRL